MRTCARSIKAGCARILVQAVPEDERWDAVRDRLTRAAAASAFEPASGGANHGAGEDAVDGAGEDGSLAVNVVS